MHTIKDMLYIKELIKDMLYIERKSLTYPNTTI